MADEAVDPPPAIAIHVLIGGRWVGELLVLVLVVVVGPWMRRVARC